jgi:hypothetical protein
VICDLIGVPYLNNYPSDNIKLLDVPVIC